MAFRCRCCRTIPAVPYPDVVFDHDLLRVRSPTALHVSNIVQHNPVAVVGRPTLIAIGRTCVVEAEVSRDKDVRPRVGVPFDRLVNRDAAVAEDGAPRGIPCDIPHDGNIIDTHIGTRVRY